MGIKSLGIGLSGLRTNLASIETTGHNIANANTEGYTRQRVDLSSRTPIDKGAYIVGQGVQVQTIARISDAFLEDRIRKENGTYSGLQESSGIMNEVEFNINELSDQDLSNKFNAFFSAMQDYSNNVSDNSTRIAFMEQGVSLANEFNRFDTSIADIQTKIDGKIGGEISNANLLLSKIAAINQEIVQTEKGGFSSSVANDLRDKRDTYLKELSSVLDIDVREESNGAAYVSSAGQKLVSQSEFFALEANKLEIKGVPTSVIQFATGIAFEIKGGRLEALVNARDDKLSAIRADFDKLAGQFIFEMNKINATGRGLEGLTNVESEFSVFDPNVPLDVAKFSFNNNEDIFKVQNGSFDIVSENISDGSTKTFTVNVDLNGIGSESTLNDIIRQMNVVPNIKAELNPQKKLQISSTNSNLQFYFANDTSDFLAAIGVNGFFSGVDSSTIAVKTNLRNNPQFISGALSSEKGDNSNAVRMVDLRNQLIFNNNKLTIDEYYQGLVGSIATETNRATELVKTHELINTNLANLKEEISGISTDEEAANLLKFQRSYQASARFVTVINDLLDTLINRLGI
jgi:flagellar hook-associated protein 1 FlgK